MLACGKALVDFPRRLILIPGGEARLSVAVAGRASLPLRRNNGGRAVKVRVVRADYTKRTMDTPGAYELIDEESGERVIVWGGTGDEDDAAPIPSKQVLSWKPGDDENRSSISVENREGSAIQGADMPSSSTRGLPAGFRRLKVQKIRNLVRKGRQKKQGIDYHSRSEELDSDVDDDDDDEVASSNSGDLFKAKKHITTKEGIKQSHQHQVKPRKNLEFDNSAGALSSFPGAPSRGWSNRQGKHSLRHESEDVKYRLKQSADGGFFSKKSFRELGCSDEMIESLRGMRFVRPSHIQAMAFASAVKGRSCIIADQSGSGKTLAYLLPVVQRLRQEELQGLSKSFPKSPRAIVLVPTSELASQVLRICRSLSKFGIPFRSMVATGGFRQKTQLESLEQEIDVLIATPGRFMYLTSEGFIQLANLRCVVLDEVDILFRDDDFELALQSLITSSLVTAQYLFVTATLPLDIYNRLVEVFPDSEVIMGPGMHRTSSGLVEVLVDCSGDEGMEKTPETAFVNKKSALLKLAEESPVSKTIVFCNKIETCRKVENALHRLDRRGSRILVLPFHAALAQETRVANMKEFLDPQSRSVSLFLICTDRASRGIDFGGVDHVILFDFPRDPSEYVRRVGRTARGAGGRGKAFVFVVGKQVSLARRIMDRNQKGHPLHQVPSSAFFDIGIN
ncbi:hypothetical protein Dimus_028418 [Dionaea muscipula]